MAVGYRSYTITNGTGSGSATIDGRLTYPADTDGQDVALSTTVPAGGFPIIVFLHGANVIGELYTELADEFARAGYVVFAHNTAVTLDDTALQVQDGIALYSLMITENTGGVGFLNGALDTTKLGLVGHSMGGGSVNEVLASNPGYKAAVAICPLNRTGTTDVPILFLHGLGDTVVANNLSQDFFAKMPVASGGDKIYHLLTTDVTHFNIAGLGLSGGTDTAVWALCHAAMTSYMNRWLNDTKTDYENVVGATFTGSTYYSSTQASIATPTIWGVPTSAASLSRSIST